MIFNKYERLADVLPCKAICEPVLKVLGTESATSPYAATYYKSTNWSIIDHVLVRKATPITGDVIDFGLYVTYSIGTNDDQRITANFKLCGSDHFLVYGVVRP